MPSCTFFGHRECPSDVRQNIRKAVLDLMDDQGVDMFYVGNQGQFDAQVRSVLRELKAAYPSRMEYAVVLAYYGRPDGCLDDSVTMFPEGIALVPKRFAISWRNRWMIDQAEYVIVYSAHSWGGASHFAESAEKKGKQCIRL